LLFITDVSAQKMIGWRPFAEAGALCALRKPGEMVAEAGIAADRVLSLIRERGKRGMTVNQLVSHITDHTSLNRSEARKRLRPALSQLAQEGRIIPGRGKRYSALEHTDLVSGRLRVTGNQTVLEPDHEPEAIILIPAKGRRGAMHGDRVLVRMERPRRRTRAAGGREGSVVRILERHRAQVVGRWVSWSCKPHIRLLDTNYNGTVVPRVAENVAELSDGDLVVVALDTVSDHRGEMTGAVVERLGQIDQPGVVEQAILRLYGLTDQFPAEALAEAQALSDTFSEHDLGDRWDLRDRPAITIDPASARDFDDAVNAYPGTGADDTIVIEVHIADVSHYVQPGTALDQAARTRSTSVYLPGCCVPMLPERVSNQLCCLQQGVDRLTYTVRFEVDQAGEITSFRLHDSVIRSRRRCTYDEVFTWLETPREQWPPEIDELADSLQLLALAADRLKQARLARGSLDFDLSEPELELDAEGRVTEIRPSRRNRAHRLIEELMLVANGCVARLMMTRSQPCLHRAHDQPGLTKIEELRQALAELGYKLEGTARELPQAALQNVLAAIAGRPEERMLATLVLRSLARAVYSPEARGHYALATDAYLHFTSPIRRYPDLLCHRQLRRLQGEGKPLAGPEREQAEHELQQLAESCSAAEQRAESAERDAVQWHTVLYLRDRVGEVFDGHITGVTDFGMFVQLDELMVDGLVHVSELVDDLYLHDEDQHALLGAHTRRRWRLGDAVQVRLVRVDSEAMQIRLAPVGLEPDAWAAQPLFGPRRNKKRNRRDSGQK
jgi:ribonuclease R